MDQLNNLLKSSCLKVLGSNFNEVSAQRIARAIGRIDEILASIDKDCMNPQEIKGRSKTDPTEAVTQIMTDLIAEDAFIYLTTGICTGGSKTSCLIGQKSMNNANK